MCIHERISANKRLSERVDRFLKLLQKVADKPSRRSPPWISKLNNVEDRLFACFIFYGTSQNWSKEPRELFFNEFDGKWSNFIDMMKNKEYDYLQCLFHNITSKGHVTRLKGHIYGSEKKGGFKKSIPYGYYKLLEKYQYSQESFFNRDFSVVCCELKKINGIKRTVSFDIASEAYTVARQELPSLEPDRIYLKDSTGPLKGFSMLLRGIRENSWAKVKMIAAAEFNVDLVHAEKAIIEFENYLVERAFELLSQVNPDIEHFEVVLALEDLICNYQKKLGKDRTHPEKFLRGLTSLEEYSIKMKRYYR